MLLLHQMLMRNSGNVAGITGVSGISRGSETTTPASINNYALSDSENESNQSSDTTKTDDKKSSKD